jgi:plasmid stabilization system protein ParE
LQHIYDYIAFDSDLYANRFITQLIQRTEKQLSKYPLSGRAVPEFDKTPLLFLHELIFKGYRIIYNPTHMPNKIVIITVLNGRMDVGQHIKEEWIIEK